MDKKYSAAEAAVAVLKKAEEMLKKHEHIGWGKLHGKLEREGYSDKTADKIAGSIKAKVEKSEEKLVDSTATGEKNITPSDDTQKDPNPLTNAHEQKESEGGWGDMKGHIKLAKFIGRMEHKRGKPAQEMDKGETGNERGIHTNTFNNSIGKPHSMSGGKPMQTPEKAKEDKVKLHQQVLGEMKQMPKPKLPG